MSEDQPAVVRAQGRPDGDRLPAVARPPHPGRGDGGVGVRWVEGGALLAVTTWGSSSSPTVPRAVRVADGELTLTLGTSGPREPTSAPRTADLTAYTTLIDPPAGLDPHAHTRVHLGDGVLDLPPAGTPLAPTLRVRPLPPTPPPPSHPGPA